MKSLSEDQIRQVVTKLAIGQNEYVTLIDMAGNKVASIKECNANIYCVDEQNNMLWQVDNTKGTFDRDSFIYIEISNNEQLAARMFFGKKYLINMNSGVQRK